MRIKSAAHFRRAYAQGSRARGSQLVVVVVPNDGKTTRLGLSIGRRIWKSAVRRNRIRRVFREAFRVSYPQLPKGVDIVLIAAQPKLEPNFEDARHELTRLAQKALRRYREKQAQAESPTDRSA